MYIFRDALSQWLMHRWGKMADTISSRRSHRSHLVSIAMENDDFIADLRARMARMPVYIGEGETSTVAVFPAPDAVAKGTYVYRSWLHFMEALDHPEWTINQYAIRARALRRPRAVKS